MVNSQLKLQETISSVQDLMMDQDFGLTAFKLSIIGDFMAQELSPEKLVSTKDGMMLELSCSKMVVVQRWNLFTEVQIHNKVKTNHSKHGIDHLFDGSINKIFKFFNIRSKKNT